MGRRRNRRFLWLLPFGPEVVYYNDHESAAQVLHGWYPEMERILQCRPAGNALYACGPWHTPDSQCSSANTAAAASRKKARTAGGYSSDCAPRAYACHIAELTAELLHAPLVQDYCCTQPCEGQNGLLAYDRTPKVPLELIWKANEG